MNPLPVLACQLFKVEYLHTLKNTLFQDSRFLLIVKSDIIIIELNTDKEIMFLFKIYKNWKHIRILDLPMRLNPIDLNT